MAVGSKNWDDAPTRWSKEFDDLDTKPQRHRQTDGQTDGNGKNNIALRMLTHADGRYKARRFLLNKTVHIRDDVAGHRHAPPSLCHARRTHHETIVSHLCSIQAGFQ